MAKPEKVIATNRKARHEYELLEQIEAGLSLLGSEVKSLRQGQATIKEAWISVEKGEAFLMGAHFPPYSHATHENHEPDRKRKLLMNRREITRLRRATKEKGLTIVPLRLFFKGPWVKLDIALARGKKLHDKRESLKKKDDRRTMRDRGR